MLGLGAAAGAGLGGLFRLSGARDAGRALLRPPGALPEADFLAACTRCGQCVEACPTGTLLTAGPCRGLSLGTPYLVSRQVPCDLCPGLDELACIAACPTAALGRVEDLRDVRMGTAVIDRDLCLAHNGTICRTCWHVCPFPDEAIRFDARLRPVVVEEACIGCGLCDYACPTETSSIPIRPAGAAREEGEG